MMAAGRGSSMWLSLFVSEMVVRILDEARRQECGLGTNITKVGPTNRQASDLQTPRTSHLPHRALTSHLIRPLLHLHQESVSDVA